MVFQIIIVLCLLASLMTFFILINSRARTKKEIRMTQIGFGIVLLIPIAVHLSNVFIGYVDEGFSSPGEWFQFTDLCPCTCAVSSIALLSGHTRFIKAMMGPAMLGGLCTMAAEHMTTFSPYDFFTIMLEHATLFLYPLILVYLMPKFDWIDLRNTMFYAAAFFAWVASVPHLTGNKHYTTAMYREALEPGMEYDFFNDILPYPYASLLFYAGSLCIVTIFNLIYRGMKTACEKYSRDTTTVRSTI